MGYDLKPRNKDAGDFHFGAFSFPVLLDACNYLFPCIHGSGQWYRVMGEDARFQSDYPELLSNDGFAITAEESRIMARIARNYVAVQRSLPEEHRGGALLDKQEGITRDDLISVLSDAMSGRPQNAPPWPLKTRDDFTDRFEKFAEWADKSGGFRIY